MESNSLSFIPTKASLLKNKTASNFEAVTFESYKSKKRKNEKQLLNNTNQHENFKEFNIKQAKQEVMKFSINKSENITEAKIQLAIKLGAKPPKNKYKNYKLLQIEAKKKKEKEAKEAGLQQLGKNSIGKSTAKGKSFDRKRRKAKDDILGIYGKVKVKPKAP